MYSRNVSISKKDGLAFFLSALALLVVAVFTSEIALAKHTDSPKTMPIANAGQSSLNPISDPQLLKWIGNWKGIYTVENDSMPIEIEWKLSLNDRWLQGTMKRWSDNKKKSLIDEAMLFIHPTDVEGIYNGYVLGTSGRSATGRAVVSEGMWKWTWEYENGNHEEGELYCYSMGKMYYKASQVDNVSKETNIFSYELNRPVVGR